MANEITLVQARPNVVDLIDGTNFVTLEDVGYILLGIGEIVGMGVDEAKASGRVLAERTWDGIRVFGMVLLLAWDEISEWTPVLARCLSDWICWTLYPVLRLIARRISRIAMKMALNARAEMMAFLEGMKGLWQMRKELINEYKEEV